MKKDLIFLERFFFKERQSLFIPMAHWVPRDPDFSGRGDTCLEGDGGYSTDLEVWWFLEWPLEIKKKTFKYYDLKIPFWNMLLLSSCIL